MPVESDEHENFGLTMLFVHRSEGQRTSDNPATRGVVSEPCVGVVKNVILG